jgi:predicted RNase H-like HicB family nuclease
MSSWKEKAKQANEKTLDAIELLTIASRKTGAEQKKALEDAFKNYQEALVQSMEAFNEGLKEYSEQQFTSYNELFVQMQKTFEEAFRKYSEAWKVK